MTQKEVNLTDQWNHEEYLQNTVNTYQDLTEYWMTKQRPIMSSQTLEYIAAQVKHCATKLAHFSNRLEELLALKAFNSIEARFKALNLSKPETNAFVSKWTNQI